MKGACLFPARAGLNRNFSVTPRPLCWLTLAVVFYAIGGGLLKSTRTGYHHTQPQILLIDRCRLAWRLLQSAERQISSCDSGCVRGCQVARFDQDANTYPICSVPKQIQRTGSERLVLEERLSTTSLEKD